MKPETPNTVPLRRIKRCTGNARPTPPRKDCMGVGEDIVVMLDRTLCVFHDQFINQNGKIMYIKDFIKSTGAIRDHLEIVYYGP